GPFLQVHQGHHIGNPVPKNRMGGPVGHIKGVDGAAAAHLGPLHMTVMAVGAERPGVKMELAARGAPGQTEPVGPGRLPERAALGIHRGERTFVHVPHTFSRPRITVAHDDSTPPVPWTSAVWAFST